MPISLSRRNNQTNRKNTNTKISNNNYNKTRRTNREFSEEDLARIGLSLKNAPASNKILENALNKLKEIKTKQNSLNRNYNEKNAKGKLSEYTKESLKLQKLEFNMRYQMLVEEINELLETNRRIKMIINNAKNM
jgi:uncharacterized protein Smg (DUF494 family)